MKTDITFLNRVLEEVKEFAASENWIVTDIRVEIATWANNPTQVLSVYVYFQGDLAIQASMKADRRTEILTLKLKAEYLNL